MNKIIQSFIDKSTNHNTGYFDKEMFAALIVKACADAADMGYEGDCGDYVGDYVGESMGYGEDKGITNWRLGS
jgi:hypothetical protein